MKPFLKTSEQAVAYGKMATPKQVKALKIMRETFLAQAREAKQYERYQTAMDLAVAAQFCREAIESSGY